MTTLNTIAPSTKRGKLVSTAHVNELVANYKKERWLENSRKIGKNDSMSTWFGLDELQSFLETAREHHADGIKMYYGVYPSVFPENPQLEGRQTIVLVATKEKQTSAGVVNKEIYRNRDGKTEILAFNFGNICPPFCTDPTGPHYPPYEMDHSPIGLSITEENGKIIIT